MKPNLTWDDLADFYKKKTGGTARTKSMDSIFDWAEKQSELSVNDDGTLSFKQAQPLTKE